jgi:hypothetical protein
MVLTEDDAKTKWCPETRVAITAGMAANRTASMSEDGRGYANIFEETRCLGSGCMLWRWQSLTSGPGGQAIGFCSLSSHER